MHIKICGLTNLDDALAAIDLGADYLGFNFYPKSQRFIAPEDCAQITSALTNHASRLTPHESRLTLVGIFVNEPPARVAAILRDCGLDLAQLHGDETPEELAELKGRAYKGVRGTGMKNLNDFVHNGQTPALLLDAYSPNAYGGTGHTVDWAAARVIAEQFPIFLAGGLTPENVADAIAQVKPWGVDVASGVEVSPRKKDHVKMRAFVEASKADEGRKTKDE
jgi:phosphoribosylanthranilate isomerase